MIQRLQVEYKISEHDEKEYMELNDRANDAFGFFIAFGQFIAPLIGAYLQEIQEDENIKLTIGTRKVCD